MHTSDMHALLTVVQSHTYQALVVIGACSGDSSLWPRSTGCLYCLTETARSLGPRCDDVDAETCSFPAASQQPLSSFLGRRACHGRRARSDEVDVPCDRPAAQPLETRPRQQNRPILCAPLPSPECRHHLEVHRQRYRSGGGTAIRLYGHHAFDQQQPGARGGGEYRQYIAEDASAVLRACVSGGGRKEVQCGCKKGG